AISKPITSSKTANRPFFILAPFCGNCRWEQIIYKVSHSSTRTSLDRSESGSNNRSYKITILKKASRMKYAKYLLAFTLCSLVLAGSASGQRPQMAEELFKNVQILKGIPVDQFMSTMGFFSASLALNCSDCHVERSGSDWARYA